MKPAAPKASACSPAVLRVSSSPTSLVPSGFGTVMEYERTLRSSTNESRQNVSGPQAEVISRTLQNQSHRLTEVISLLQRRCAMLPHPTRFLVLGRGPHRLPASRAAGTTPSPDGLADLLVQHRGLLERLRRLIRPHPVGDRGQAMLAEVMRNHAQMVWRLNTLLEDEGRSGNAPQPAGAQRT